MSALMAMTSPNKTRSTRFTTTAALIRKGRGILKRKPGQKPLAEEWEVHTRHERDLEDRMNRNLQKGVRL